MAVPRAVRLFESFATAVLDVGLPSLRAWLKSKVGDGADVSSFVVERNTVHLLGVRVPIPPRGLLVLDRATFAIAGKRAIGLPELSLTAFRGVLRFGKEGELVFEAPLVYRGDDDGIGDAWVSGEVAILGATWTASAGAEDLATTAPPLRGRARLRVTPRAWSVDGGELTLAGGGAVVARFGARGAMNADDGLARATLDVIGARAGHVVDAVAALVGQRLEARVPLPFDALLDGEASWSAGSGGSASFRARTAATSIAIEGTLSTENALTGSIDATLGAAEWMARAGVPAALRPADDDRVRFRATLGGSLDAWEARGALESHALRFRLGGPRYIPGDVAAGLHVTLEATSKAVSVRGKVDVAGGTVTVHASQKLAAGASPRLDVRAAGLSGARVVKIVRKLAPAAAFEAPEGTELRAHGLLEGGAWRGEIAVKTPRSEVAIAPLVFEGEKLDGSRVTGVVSIDEAVAAGLLARDVLATGASRVAVNGALSGALTEPRAEGTLRVLESSGVLPTGSTATGELRFTAAGSVHGAAALESPAGSALLLELAAGGPTLRGKLSLADIVASSARNLPVRFASSDAHVVVDAVIGGTLEAPRLSGGIRASSLAVIYDGATYVVDDLATLFDVEQDRVAWQGLAARFAEGIVTSSGCARIAGDALVDLRATLGVERVVVHRVPAAAPFVRGRLSALLCVQQRGAGAIEGVGHARLDDAAYPALDLARPRLARFGLPPPTPSATSPAHVAVRLNPAGVSLHDIALAVPAGAVAGQLWVGLDGKLRGALRITLRERWLRESPWLLVPGMITGDVEIPLTVRGTVQAPEIGGELWATLESLLAKNRVTSAVTQAWTGVANVFSKADTRAKHARARASPPAPPHDATIEEVTREVDAVRLAVADAADWEAIEAALEARRAPRSRVRVAPA